MIFQEEKDNINALICYLGLPKLYPQPLHNIVMEWNLFAANLFSFS